MVRSANKGEWSEFYAFLKMLVDKELVSADENLNIIPSSAIPILRIIRKEKKDRIREYEFCENFEISIFAKNDDDLKLLGKIDSTRIKSSIKLIFTSIKNKKGSSFPILETEELMQLLYCESIKAGNEKKEDINLIIHNPITSQNINVGYSIKSEIGSLPTLLNASQGTNFIYEIKNIKLNNGEIEEINQIGGRRKIQDRLSFLYRKGGEIQFSGISSDVFRRNLRKADTAMPIILSEYVKYFYEAKAVSIEKLTNLVEKSPVIQILKFTDGDIKFKISHLLVHIALGMIPKKPWDGEMRADGGYIIVREDGDLVCFHIYNIKNFCEYLFNNTKLETASSSRHKFGYVYKKDDKLFINLNLQIRFK